MEVVVFRAAKEPEDPYDLVSWRGSWLLKWLGLYFQALRGATHAPHFIPALHFQFINQDALSSALLNASKYSGSGVPAMISHTLTYKQTHTCVGVVFTSQTAVEAANSALVTSGSRRSPEVNTKEQLTEQWESHPVFAVGKATAQAGETLNSHFTLTAHLAHTSTSNYTPLLGHGSLDPDP